MGRKTYKLLVLGGTGMAGHTIALYFQETGHDVTVFSRKGFQYCQSIQGEITDLKWLKSLLIEGQYDAVVNAIGLLNADAESNKSMAVFLNSFLPHYLSDLTRGTKIRVVHLSTDCVFSGKKGGYIEGAVKDGESFYDRTKSLGEIINDKDLTFRNSIVGPDMDEQGIGLFNWFMKQSGGIKGFKSVLWTGVTTITLAKAIAEALHENINGVYHLVNNVTISKCDLLQLFNHYFKNNRIEIVPNHSVVLDKSLTNSRIDFSFKVPSYDMMIAEMKSWVENHSQLYPHYFL